MTKRVGVILGVFLMVSAVPLHANSILAVYSASVPFGGSSSGSSTVTASFTNSVAISNGGIPGNLTGTEFASAGPGGVRGSATMILSQPGVPGLGGTGAAASSSASATFYDFMITGPAGATSVPASLNLHLSGTIIDSAIITAGLSNILIQAGSTVGVGVSGGLGATSFSGAFSQTSGATGAGSAGTTTSATGVFASHSGPGSFSVLASLPVGSPFIVSLQLVTSAQAGYGAFGTIAGNFATTVDLNATSNFSNTFSFPTSGPVFNLPGGYTVNSVSAGIINNQYFGGGAAPTPEPGTLMLLGTGLLSLGVFRRRG